GTSLSAPPFPYTTVFRSDRAIPQVRHECRRRPCGEIAVEPGLDELRFTTTGHVRLSRFVLSTTRGPGGSAPSPCREARAAPRRSPRTTDPAGAAAAPPRGSAAVARRSALACGAPPVFGRQPRPVVDP